MNTQKTLLYLFTEQFPFGVNSEQAFLRNEIQYLCRNFEVVVIPQIITEKQTTSGDFSIDTSLSVVLSNRNKIKLFVFALFCKYLYNELLLKKISFWNIWRLKRLFYFVGRTYQVHQWSKISISNKKKCLVYTYWTNEITLGLIHGTKNKSINVISRAHGHDLYEEYYNYIPCYHFIIKDIKRIYLVSERGLKYLSEKYPKYIGKLFLRYLGVQKAEKVSEQSNDLCLRIVSCSYIIPLKRIHLIIDGIHEYISTYNKRVEWTHFGSGELLVDIKSKAENIKDNNFKFNFMGFISNNSLLKYYQSNPVDVFITTSESEGGVPVSLQEAQSYGIPIIGTNVGGISEIVNNNVGVLLSENPSITEISDAIYWIISDKAIHNNMRKKSIENWAEKFDEQKNYRLFVEELQNI